MQAMKGETALSAPMLLMKLIEAAIKLGEVNNPAMSATPKLVEAHTEFERVQAEAIAAYTIVCTEAECFRATQEMPTTETQALRMMIGSQAMYVRMSADYLDRMDTWRRADAQSARIREQCVAQLQLPRPEGDGLSATAAKTAASNHIRYTEHKDFCVELSAAKDAAYIEMQVAEQAVKNARSIFIAMTSEGGQYLITGKRGT